VRKKVSLFPLLLIGAGSLSLGPPARAAAESAKPARLALAPLIEEALQKNPELNALRRKAEAAKARIRPAGALDDPRIMLEDATGRRDFGMNMLGLRQMVPYPGKLSLMQEMARLEYVALEYETREKSNEVVKRVKQAYYDLFEATKSIEIAERNKKLLEDFVQVASTRYAVGKGIQQDVLKAHVELSRMIQELIMLEKEKKTAQAELNTLLSKMPDSPLLDPQDLAPSSFRVSLQELLNRAEKERPLLLSASSMVQMQTRRQELAKLGLRPDFEVGVNYYTFGMDAGNVSGSFMMTVPWAYARRKQKELIREAESNAASSQQQLQAMKNETFFAIRDSAAGFERADRELKLLETSILPQAESSLAAARAAYQVGKVDFLTLLDSLMTWYGFDMQRYRAVADREAKLAELEALVGGKL
jgi:outer membrane protein TolC